MNLTVIGILNHSLPTVALKDRDTGNRYELSFGTDTRRGRNTEFNLAIRKGESMYQEVYRGFPPFTFHGVLPGQPESPRLAVSRVTTTFLVKSRDVECLLSMTVFANGRLDFQMHETPGGWFGQVGPMKCLLADSLSLPELGLL